MMKMKNACVLVTVQTGSIDESVDAIKQIEHVRVVFPSFGQWDIVVWLQTEDFVALTRNALRINNILGVISTETLLPMDVNEIQ